MKNTDDEPRIITRSQKRKRQENDDKENNKKQKKISGNNDSSDDEPMIKIKDFKDIMEIVMGKIPEILFHANNFHLPMYDNQNSIEYNNGYLGNNWVANNEYSNSNESEDLDESDESNESMIDDLNESDEEFDESDEEKENDKYLRNKYDMCDDCVICKKCIKNRGLNEECKECKKCDICQIDNGKKIYRDMKNDEYFKKLSHEQQIKYIQTKSALNHFCKRDVPLKYKILDAPLDLKNKMVIMERINEFENLRPGTGEYNKLNKWVEGISKVPFGKYAKIPVDITSPIKEKHNFLLGVHQALEKSVYGQIDAKSQILQILSQWISNPNASNNLIALQGPPGIGKTTLIKHGLASQLGIPFCFIPLGGASDASILEGHGYTYEGSMWGRIVDVLMQSKCMNPIIYFDELDKISNTPKGDEIIGILMHLIDSTQNDQFHDVYFSGIDFDLSKTLFIFSYNDENKINPILRDRLRPCIKLDGFNINDKIKISKNYLVPEILRNIGFEFNEIIIPDEIIRYVINTYTQNEENKGVRQLKECLNMICQKINLLRFIQNDKDINLDYYINDFKLPITLTIDLVNKLLKSNKIDKNHFSMYI